MYKTQNYMFNAAIYVRLSREDENIGQSESIKNQQDFLVKYVQEQDWILYDIYCDDGYTGINFDRPAFQRMLKDIEAKKVNLVLTKDQSRLGRDHIETGFYIEKYFPSKGVRYIALNDGVDTFCESSSNDMTPFRLAMNDMYAKDISKKVRTSLNTKREKGEYIGSFPLYGYIRDPANKSRLVVDPEAALVVKRIYDMFIEGHSMYGIAKQLSEEGVLIPNRYKAMKYSSFNISRLKYDVWTHETIAKILANPTYCGNLTQNFTARINYKIKTQKTLPKSQWITKKGTHEPIISEEDFVLVQTIKEKRPTPMKSYSKSAHILSGLLFCGDCGERITFTHGIKGHIYTICSRYKKMMKYKVCTSHGMPEHALNKLVLDDLRILIQNYSNKEELEKLFKSKKRVNSFVVLEKDIIAAETEIKLLNLFLKDLYQNKTEGLIIEERYKELQWANNEEWNKLKTKLEALKKKKERQSGLSNSSLQLDIIENAINPDYPDRALLFNLIDKVKIFQDEKEKSVVIYYKFKMPF